MKSMKKLSAWLLSAALLMGMSALSVSAAETEPETQPVTVDMEKSGFDEEAGLFHIYVTIHETDSENVELDLASIAHNVLDEYAKEYGLEEYTVMPGDSNPFRFYVTNESGHLYAYQEGSLHLSTADSSSSENVSPFTGFDGQKIPYSFIGSVPASHKAIYKELFGVSGSSKVTAEMMFNLYDYLEEKGYTGDSALTDFMLDYYNGLYRSDYTTWEKLVEAKKTALCDTFAQSGVNSIFTMSYAQMKAYCEEHPELAPYVQYTADSASPADDDAVKVQIKWPEEKLASFSYNVFYEDFFSFAYGEEEMAQLNPNGNTTFTRMRGVGDYMVKDGELYQKADAYFASLENASSLADGESLSFDFKWAVDGPGVGNSYQKYGFSYEHSITLARVDGDVTVSKVNESNEPLTGAEFVVGKTTESGVVYWANGQWTEDPESASVYTSQDGVFTVEKLPFGEYFLEEIKAPEGYDQLTERIAFTVDQAAEAITVVNTALEEIPEESTPSAGPSSSSTEEIPDESTPSAPATGEGTSPVWMVAGMILVALCGGVLMISRKKTAER